METVKRYIKYLCLLNGGVVIGMAFWVLLETAHVAPPMCVVEQSAYDQAPIPTDARIRRKGG